MFEALTYQLKALRLSGVAQALPLRLHEAKANDLPHLEFLQLLVQDELARRRERLLNRRLKAAGFSEMKTLDQFDFSFNPSLSKKTILELGSGRFVQQAQGVVILGPPGVGKTHLSIGLGIAAIHHGYTVLYRSAFDLVDELAEAAARGERKALVTRFIKTNLLILDEFGMRQLSKNAAEDLLEIFHRRYHRGATIGASNRPLEDWGKILGDNAAASAILDRFLEAVTIVKITGKSYRLHTKNVVDNEAANA